MDVRAILVITGHLGEPQRETLGDVPIALLPVLGRPVVSRFVERLQQAGFSTITVISDAGTSPYSRAAQAGGLRCTEAAAGEDLWRAAESLFNEFAQAGAELVLVARLGPYVELELDPLVQFHLDQRHRVTVVDDADGPLPLFLISASRRNDAAYLLRHRLTEFRSLPGRFRFHGYANPLAGAWDLRRLALDSLFLRTGLQPDGREIKPGVWLGERARIHRSARVLAPAYIGAASKIRAAAVLTRGTVVEHHSEVDCGSVVEDSSILPYTYVGAGLDLCHAVVGFRQLVHLERDVAVEIGDGKLVGMAPANAPLRLVAAAASLASFLPQQFFRGLFATSQREPLSELSASIKVPPPALQSPAAELENNAVAETNPSKFPANLVVARRYGDQ